jgi:type IV secretory pathway protease TraF
LFRAPCGEAVTLEETMRRIALLLTALLALAGVALAQAPSTVTITGYVYNNSFSAPMVGSTVEEFPANVTIQGNTIVGQQPCQSETDQNGYFSMACPGGVEAIVYIPDLGSIIKANLPSSGTVTLQQLVASGTNVVTTSFPPNANLPMGGYSFTNMGPALLAGMPSVLGSGLANSTVFSNSGTYSVPQNATILIAIVVGGGGGGGGGNSGASNGGGGGGGPQVMGCMLLPANGVVAVTIGPAGTGGASGANGTSGGNSVVSQNSAAYSCTANGGAYGAAGSGGGPGSGGSGGSGGVAAGAALELYQVGGANGSNGSSGAGGAGAGASQFGGLGGNPSGGAGAAGRAGFVFIRAY